MQHNQKTDTVKTVQTVEQSQKPIDHQPIPFYAVSPDSIVILLTACTSLAVETRLLTDSANRTIEAMTKLIEVLDKLTRNRRGKNRKTR